MPEHQIPLSAAQISSALQKVQDADTSPQLNSDNMITSDAVAKAVAEEASARESADAALAATAPVAFINFNGVTLTTVTQKNFSSVTRVPAGSNILYKLTFTTPQPDANYCVVTSSSAEGVYSSAYMSGMGVGSLTATGFHLNVRGSGPDGGEANQPVVCAVVYR